MRVKFDEDEWYPVYILYPENEPHVNSSLLDIPDEKMKEYQRIVKEFESMQMYIESVINKQRETG